MNNTAEGQATPVTTRDAHHITHPKEQAEKDFSAGLDIGHNPYPLRSQYWQAYREAFVDCQLGGMAEQMAPDEDRCTSDYADEYLSDTSQGMRHDEDMEDLG